MSFIKKIKEAPITLKASIAYTICSILQKSLSFITMPLFTHLLTKEEYGLYTIYTSWSAIFSIVITLNLTFGCFGPAMLKYSDKREEYVSSIQSMVFLLGLLFLAIYLPFSSFFNSLIELPTKIMVIMVAEIVTQFGLQCWFGLEKYRFKYWPVVIITLLMSVLSPVLAYYLIITSSNDKGNARIMGYALISIIFGGCIMIYNLLKGKRIGKKEYWAYALRFNLPLIVYYFSQVIFNQSDKIMIQKMCENGKADAAVYGVGYSIALILTFVLNSINSAYEPWLFNSIKDNNFKNNKIITAAITIIISTLIGGVVWISPEVVKIMAGNEYLEAIYVIPPVSISLVLLLYSQFTINIEMYYAERWRLVAASIAAAILNVVLNFLLIPVYGFVAAAYTTLISYVIFFLCNYLSIIRHIKRNKELHGIFDFKVLLVIFMLFVGASYVGVALYDYILIRYIIISTVIVVLLILTPFILKYINKIKSKYINNSNDDLDEVISDYDQDKENSEKN